MTKNAMKWYLEEYKFKCEYEENEPLKNYFRYWKKFWIDKANGIEIDKKILEKELNQEYPNADTIISLWTPLKKCMDKLNVPEKLNGIKISKYSKDFYDEILKDDVFEKCFPKDNGIVKKLNELSKLTCTRANTMSIPQGRFNNDRYQCSLDQMPLTLHHCFKGKLKNYFNSEEILKHWITSQKLELCFVDKQIKYENIIDLDKYINNNFKAIFPKISDEEEIYIEMLDKYINFIIERNKLLDDNN